MNWTIVRIGKYRDKGKTLPQIVFDDPDWFYWAMEEGVFDSRAALLAEAKIVAKRARSIRIPADSEVEYFLHPLTLKFVRFEIVPGSRPRHRGSSPTMRGNVIDMSVPRSIAPYDKVGCKTLVRGLKEHLFGKSSARVTKQRAEEFFADASNFA